MSAESSPAILPKRVPAPVIARLRQGMPQMTALMESAILAEVPRYREDPERYRGDVLELCRLATRIFLRILETGRPPGSREVAVVQLVGRTVAAGNEPLEPLLHALRIGARVGWDQTLRAGITQREVLPEELLGLAGQVFEYIDQLSSRIAEAYASQLEEAARARVMTESALFEELVSGRSVVYPPGSAAAASPRVALAVAPAEPDRAAARAAGEIVAGRLRTRFPRTVSGQRHGLAVWLLPREPLAQVLADCAAGTEVVFGSSSVGEDTSMVRAVEEAVVAARMGVELRHVTGRTWFDFPSFYPYAALRSDPAGLARAQASILGPLLENPSLLATLREYFAQNRSVSRTAARVHLHRQSVIYRLRRAAQLLDARFDDGEAMWRIEAAVRALPPA